MLRLGKKMRQNVAAFAQLGDKVERDVVKILGDDVISVLVRFRLKWRQQIDGVWFRPIADED